MIFYVFITSTYRTKIKTRISSFSLLSKTHGIVFVGEKVNFDKLTGYLGSYYNVAQWLYFILGKNADENDIRINFLHLPGQFILFFT